MTSKVFPFPRCLLLHFVLNWQVCFGGLLVLIKQMLSSPFSFHLAASQPITRSGSLILWCLKNPEGMHFSFLCSLLFEDSLKKLLFYWPKKMCWRGTRVEALVTGSTKKKIELRAHGFHRSPPLCLLILLVSSLQNSFYRWTSFHHITAEIELYEIPLWHKVLT